MFKVGDTIQHKTPYKKEPCYRVVKVLGGEIVLAVVKRDNTIWDNGWHYQDFESMKFYRLIQNAVAN